MFNFTPVVRLLLIANVAIFLLASSAGEWVVDRFGLHSVLSAKFNPIQLVTHMFMHGGWGHIFSNMIGLIVFGPMLERVWGGPRFFLFYMLTGLGAAALYLGVNYYETSALVDSYHLYQANPTNSEFVGFVTQYANSYLDGIEPFIQKFDANPTNPAYINYAQDFVNKFVSVQVDTPMVGASGAIFGVIMAFGLLFPNTELILLFPPIPIKAKYLVLFYGAYEVYSGIYQAQSDNVAHFAHIGGMLFAYILVKLWGFQQKTFY